jgi:hypothetical protein
VSLKNVGGEWKPKPTSGLVYIRKKKVAGSTGWWDDKKKLEAVTTYAACGSISMTSAIVNVPAITLKRWKITDWWKDLTNDLLFEETIKLDKKLERILDKSLDAVLDRVENGDYMYDPRTGKQLRIPAKLRDVQKVTSDMVDKRQLLKKANAPIKVADDKQGQVTADHLIMLAQAFAQFSTGKAPKDVINIMDTEALAESAVITSEASVYALHEKR